MRLALARAALLDDVGLRGGEPTVRRDGLELAGLERRTRIVLDVVTLEGHSAQLDDLG